VRAACQAKPQHYTTACFAAAQCVIIRLATHAQPRRFTARCSCPLQTLRMSLPVFAPDMSMRTVAG
jgi:hypothetical protein